MMARKTSRLFEGTARIDAFPIDNRGLAYGDGLFETMRVHCGTVPWWDAHWGRLNAGARRLRLPLPGQSQASGEAAALFADGADGVLKLLVIRGGGGRGYAPLQAPAPVWMVSRHPLPVMHEAGGLHLQWCETRLALQPALAGIKQCNRLEQVLARMECVDMGADEGLMCDTEGSVVSATAANLFVLCNGEWMTPPVDRCGVAGVCRSHLLALLDARERRLSVDDTQSADAIFLCNAVRGILPVAQLGARTWPSHHTVDAAQRELARIHPGFAFQMEHS